MKMQKVVLTVETIDGGKIEIEVKAKDKKQFLLVVKTPSGAYENHPVYPTPSTAEVGSSSALIVKRIGYHLAKGNAIVNILPYKKPVKK